MFAVDTKLGGWFRAAGIARVKPVTLQGLRPGWKGGREVQGGAVLSPEITQSSLGDLPHQAVNVKLLAHEGFLLIN